MRQVVVMVTTSYPRFHGDSVGTFMEPIAKSVAALGHEGEVPSPSFAIVQPYDELSPPVWHVDLYRIEQPSDVEELGLDDIREEAVLIVEWPEHAGDGIWPDALALSLEALEDGSRSLTARVPAAWEGRWSLS